MERVILLIDMDAFFASVEQQSNPSLRGKPIAVVGAGKRTVVTTSSYEARARGVKTGMNLYEAKQVCPELTVVVGNNHKYTYTCTKLRELYLQYTPDVEIYSVDEAFLDVTTTEHLFGGPLQIGKMIKREIKRRFGINATVGIGPNKLIAKLAADLSKPDGLRWIKKQDVPHVLENLPVEELWGVGKRMAEHLGRLGIRTCGELARTPVGVLRSRFGIVGEHLKRMAQGLDDSPVVADGEETEDVKSIGHSMTLPEDVHRMPEIRAYLLLLCDRVSFRARQYGYKGRTVTLIIRYRSFETFSVRKKLDTPTDDSHRLFRAVCELLDGLRLREPVRLLGVSMGSLQRQSGQLALFPEQDRRRRLLETMDRINLRHGLRSIVWAATLEPKRQPGVISPAWRPEGVHRSL